MKKGKARPGGPLYEPTLNLILGQIVWAQNLGLPWVWGTLGKMYNQPIQGGN